MTKDELTALRRERGKQELNIGDKVIVHSASDKPLYDGKVATIIEKGISGNEVYFGLYIEGVIVEKRSKPLIGAAGIIGTTSLLAPFYAEDLELVKEPTDEIKVGDRVVAHVGENMDWYGTVKKIIPDTNGLYGENLLEIRIDDGCLLQHRVSRCTKIDIHKVANDFVKDMTDAMEEYRKNFAKIMSELVDFDWQQYRAELVKEIAVKLADKETIMCPSIADYTTNFATRIADNLKKQSDAK